MTSISDEPFRPPFTKLPFYLSICLNSIVYTYICIRFGTILDHFWSGGAHLDALKQSIADQSGFCIILMDFWVLLGGHGAFQELRFQPWRAPGPPEKRKNCTKYDFRGTLEACESVVQNRPCPEGWFYNENIMNNEVFARRHYRQFGAKLAPKRYPK